MPSRPRPIIAAAVVSTAALLIGGCGQQAGSGPRAEVEVRALDEADTGDQSGAVLVTQDTDDPGSDSDTSADGDAAPTDASDVPAFGDLLMTEPLEDAGEVESLNPEEISLQFDTTQNGEIDQLFGADRWNFTGTAGQALTVQVESMGGPGECRQDLDLYLVAPDGSIYDLGWIGNSGCRAYGPWALPLDGDYGLQFVGGDGGIIQPNLAPYSFTAFILTDVEQAPLMPGVQTVGGIDQVFGVDRWTFEADAGQRLAIDVSAIGDDCRQDLRMFLIDPAGQRTEVAWIGNSGCRGYGPLELTETGAHALEFVGGHGGIISPATGSYTFTAALS
ncbi:MAG: hypothetical protein AAGD35_20635 [Actinomycetota bacterium]